MLNKLMNAILKEERAIAIENVNFHEWTTIIYLNNNTWKQIVAYTSQHEPIVCDKLRNRHTIRGHNVYRVLSDTHPNFAIFSIPPKEVTKRGEY